MSSAKTFKIKLTARLISRDNHYFKNVYLFSMYLALFYKDFIYFWREEKGGRKRGRETSVCSCLSCTPYWRPGLQPKYVPWLGIELATLWFTGRHSIHWATPARAYPACFSIILYGEKFLISFKIFNRCDLQYFIYGCLFVLFFIRNTSFLFSLFSFAINISEIQSLPVIGDHFLRTKS